MKKNLSSWCRTCKHPTCVCRFYSVALHINCKSYVSDVPRQCLIEFHDLS